MKRLRECASCANWVPLAGSKFGECHAHFEIGTDGKIKWAKTQGDLVGCPSHTEGYDSGQADDASEGTALHLPDHGLPHPDKPSEVAKGKVGKP